MSNESDSESLFVLNPDPQSQLKSDDSVLVYQDESSGFRVAVRRVHQIHGFLNGPDSASASLLVLRFKLTNKNDNDGKRRWKRFFVELRFETDPACEPKHDPWVKAYEPSGTVFLTETIAKAKSTRNYGLKANAKAPLNVDLGAEFAHDRSSEIEYEERYLHTVEADRQRTERGGGREGEDIVYWNMRENDKEGVGIADETQVAILVIRPNKDGMFKVYINLKATVDFRYRLMKKWESFWGHKAKVICFDPAMTPEPAPDAVKPDKLGNLLLNDDEYLRALSYIHVPEKFMSKEFYSLTRPIQVRGEPAESAKSAESGASANSRNPGDIAE